MKLQKFIFSERPACRFCSLLSKDTHLIDMFQSLQYKIWPTYFMIEVEIIVLKLLISVDAYQVKNNALTKNDSK